MEIAKKSKFTGKLNEMNLPITDAQLENWKNGMLIQHAMPNLSSMQKEFLITGMSEEEQDDFYNNFEDD